MVKLIICIASQRGGFINPPLSFARGIIVNQQGKRFINETVYGATLGVEMGENQNGKAWLVLNKALIKQALQDVSGGQGAGFSTRLSASEYLVWLL